MNTTTMALLTGLMLGALQAACEMPNANTPGVSADGRGIGSPPPLARPTPDPGLAAPPPPPPAAPPRRAAAPAP